MSRRDRRLTLPGKPPDAPTAALGPGNPPSEAVPLVEDSAGDPANLSGPETSVVAEAAPVRLRMRLSAGVHAISAGEAEVLVDGARIAGGSGTFQFNLWVETWIDISVIRP